MIYLDHASTTPVDPKVVKKMTPYFSDRFGNPSGLYGQSREAKHAMDDSRQTIAKFLGCKINEIIFTAGGTESDNLAVLGVARAWRKRRGTSPEALARGGQIITSKIEHSAVLNSCRQLEKEGFKVTYLDVDKDGVVKLDQLKKALTKDTILVSIMYSNNEIGTIQQIAKISKIVRDFRSEKGKVKSEKENSDLSAYPLMHTDACQAAGYLEMNVEKLGVELLTFNGSKIYAPKGIGVLYKREGVEIEPIIYGGEQENGLRPGTENVPYIVGLAEAVKLISKTEGKKEQKLRNFMISELLKIKNSHLNGSLKNRLPNNINITFDGVEGESAILYLDKLGISLSTGSACMSANLKPSHVIMALNSDEEAAHSSLRISLGRTNTKKQIIEAIKKIKKVVKELREISARYNSER